MAPNTAPAPAPAPYTGPAPYTAQVPNPSPAPYPAPAPYASPYATSAPYSQPTASTKVYQPPDLSLPPEAANSFSAGPIPVSPPGPSWTIDADALWLQRNMANFGSLGETILYSPVTDVAQLNIGGVGQQPGMRLQLTYRVDGMESWEAVYFGLQQWTSTGTIYGDPNRSADYGNGPIVATSPYTQSDVFIGPFAGSMGYTYISSLNNAEINHRAVQVVANNWTIDTVVGFRFVEWNERFQLNSVNSAANPYYPFYYYENENTSTHNTLLGAQVGYGVRRNWERLALQFNTKVALMGNIVHQTYSNLNSTLYLTNGFGGLYSGFSPILASNTSLDVAGVLDFSAMASFQVTRHFSLRGGYQLLYIPGLALAPLQLSSLSHNQGVLLQGPSAGLTIQW
jgi:hypothetical protein